MKKFKLTHVLGAALIGMASFTSCTDACKDVTCENGGVCVEGDCECADFYEGTTCADAFSTKFVTTSGATADVVTAADTANSGTYNYTLVIAANGAGMITMTPFGGFTGTTITADMDPNNSNAFDIASQTDQASRTFSGSGSINAAGSEVTINYTVTYSDNTSDTGVATVTL